MFDFDGLAQTFLFGLFRGLPFAIAIFLGLAIPMFFVVASYFAQRASKSLRLVILLASIILGTTLSIALSGRELLSNSEWLLNPALAGRQVGSMWGIRASQLFTLVALAISFTEIVGHFVRREKLSSRGLFVLLAFIAFYLTSVILSGLFGTYRNLQPNDIYFVFVGSALIILADGSDGRFWTGLRWALFIPILGSLIAIFVMPKLAMQPGYKSFIPGLTERLHGLADHSNSLGALAVLSIALELCPKVRLKPSIIFLALQLAVLLLAQSKTAWVMAVLVVVIVRWQWFREQAARGDAWRASVLTILVGVFAICTLLVVVFAASESKSFVRMAEASKLFTFTGRFELWGVTLEEFSKSPFLGYGPSLWDVQYRAEHGMLFAGQAHNQFVHILGQAGGLGFVAMITYLVLMLRFSVINLKSDHGLSLAIFTSVLIRCLTESPLRMLGIMDWENFIHLLMIVAVVSSAKRSSDQKTPNLVLSPAFR